MARYTLVWNNMEIHAKCENCGTDFTYIRQVSVKMAGRFTEVDRERSSKWIQNNIQERVRNQDLWHEKCPECGYTQSWMVPDAVAKWRNGFIRNIVILSPMWGVCTLLSLGIAAIGLLPLFGFLGGNPSPKNIIIGVIFIIVPLVFIYWFFYNIVSPPNPNRKYPYPKQDNTPTVKADGRTIS